MRSEREKITGKVAAATLRLNANRHELLPDEDTCYLLLVSEGSVTLEYGRPERTGKPRQCCAAGPGRLQLCCRPAAPCRRSWGATFRWGCCMI